MKFFIDKLTKCVPRLGKLKEIEKQTDLCLETPLPMLYTRGGSIPHITYEVFELITKDPQIIQIPLATTYHFNEVLSQYEGNITDFVGMKDCLSCVSVQDPGDLVQPGHHIRGKIPLWTRAGKVILNAEDYMTAIKAFKPDMYYFLSDGDTNLTSAAKRINKSIENTELFLKECHKIHGDSDELKNAFVIIPIVGGYCKKSRERFVDTVSKLTDFNKYGGYLIDGLHNNGPEAEFIQFAEIEKITEFTINKLSPDKLRVIQGCWNPVVILNLIKLGVDIFDTSYCNLITERSSALTFGFDEYREYEINLRQPKYAEDFQPILADCECVTCQKHSRGYIHHLVTVQELLGPLLLTIHNNHHFMKFFKKVRESIANNALDSLTDLVSAQYKEHHGLLNKAQKSP